jgi:hypothetical protein
MHAAWFVQDPSCPQTYLRWVILVLIWVRFPNHRKNPRPTSFLAPLPEPLSVCRTGVLLKRCSPDDNVETGNQLRPSRYICRITTTTSGP